ncbi:RNA polymerase subunit sigma-24, partial [Streptomyces fagopyri]
ILETSETNTRQLVSRARKHLAAERREPVNPTAHRRLLEVFLAAAQTGSLTALEDVLSADVVSYTDGGGIRGASRIPVVGRPHVSKYLAAFAPRFWPGTAIRWVESNGTPAALISSQGHPMALLSLDASQHGIERLMWIMNPAKLEPYVASLSA